MQELNGRVAVVTGAGSGIGAALGRRCAEAGMSVMLADVEAGPLEEVAGAIRETGAAVETAVLDVRDAAAVEGLAARTWEAFGACHLLVNNAGVVLFRPASKLTLADWEWVLSVNLHGVVHGLTAFLPRLRDQGGEAHIVNTASINGLLPMAGTGLAAYAATKYGVVAISESLRVELERDGIGVSVVVPGGVATRITQSERNRPEALRDGPTPPAPRDRAGAKGRLERPESRLAPEEVADRILEGVRENAFWIVTHPGYLEELRARHREIEAAFERAARRSSPS
jgi:NAD(P)-dependent dehydrogenase (short-subunit alcohol dehydrogenase family)